MPARKISEHTTRCALLVPWLERPSALLKENRACDQKHREARKQVTFEGLRVSVPLWPFLSVAFFLLCVSRYLCASRNRTAR